MIQSQPRETIKQGILLESLSEPDAPAVTGEDGRGHPAAHHRWRTGIHQPSTHRRLGRYAAEDAAFDLRDRSPCER